MAGQRRRRRARACAARDASSTARLSPTGTASNIDRFRRSRFSKSSLMTPPDPPAPREVARAPAIAATSPSPLSHQGSSRYRGATDPRRTGATPLLDDEPAAASQRATFDRVQRRNPAHRAQHPSIRAPHGPVGDQPPDAANGARRDSPRSGADMHHSRRRPRRAIAATCGRVLRQRSRRQHQRRRPIPGPDAGAFQALQPRQP